MLCDPMDYSLPGSSVHGPPQAKIPERVAIPFYKELNQGLLHFRQILYHLSHQGSPRILEWVALTKTSISIIKNSEFIHDCTIGKPYAVQVTQSCPTLWDPVDCSPPCSSVHGIFQARVLEWGAISFSRGSSWPRDWTQVSSIVSKALYRLSHKGSPVISLVI